MRYAWIAFDVILNVASVNGADPGAIAALRLGGHVPAAVWFAVAALQSAGPVRGFGVMLGTLLLLHAFSSPWVPSRFIFIPFVMIPMWFTLVGVMVRRRIV